ncbi:hypothetical protein JOF48_000785 [Arthrobacter stackebrandtii]|uniref:HTH marR-type domain-containing protein n=1 Tax=Arthrobacter stackebrandtii TaxID=272161 RepID=A0ABS4YT58_9MICC|nr:hypothetical protein [Arthrobacter stackebrandtii]
MASTEATPTPLPGSLYDVDAVDPQSQLVDRSAMSKSDIAHIGELMAALGRLRTAEQQLSDASLKYMKLNQTDMRALHYLIVAANTGAVATPGAIAGHLKISTASTTKLLDRLEKAGHITRSPTPATAAPWPFPSHPKPARQPWTPWGASTPNDSMRPDGSPRRNAMWSSGSLTTWPGKYHSRMKLGLNVMPRLNCPPIPMVPCPSGA